MRRIASSRLIGGPASSNNSRHTSAGSRSSNGLRKLTGAGVPVAGEFGFGGKLAIGDYACLLRPACSATRRIISSRLTIWPLPARNRRQASSAPGPWNGLGRAAAEKETEFGEVAGDCDAEGCEFSGAVIISQSYENKPPIVRQSEQLPRVGKLRCRVGADDDYRVGAHGPHLGHGHAEALQIRGTDLAHVEVEV